MTEYAARAWLDELDKAARSLELPVGNSKLKPSTVAAVAYAYARGVPVRRIAEGLGVSEHTVRLVGWALRRWFQSRSPAPAGARVQKRRDPLDELLEELLGGGGRGGG